MPAVLFQRYVSMPQGKRTVRLMPTGGGFNATMVRLKGFARRCPGRDRLFQCHNGSIKSSPLLDTGQAYAQSFNATLVRSKVAQHPQALRPVHCFNATLVRLKASRQHTLLEKKAGFNATLVRLKDARARFIGVFCFIVSMPHWFD